MTTARGCDFCHRDEPVEALLAGWYWIWLCGECYGSLVDARERAERGRPRYTDWPGWVHADIMCRDLDGEQARTEREE